MTVSTWTNDRVVLNGLVTVLQANLTDPRLTYVVDTRTWIHLDSPRADATYPRIYLKKRGPTETQIIDIGLTFVEWRMMVVEIHFKTKAPFMWKTSDNVELRNEELVKEYLDKIWQVLKSNLSSLDTTYGIT